MKQNHLPNTSARKALIWLKLACRVICFALMLDHTKGQDIKAAYLIFQVFCDFLLPTLEDCLQLKDYNQGMNFNDWLKAVDQALKANGKGYTSSQIDLNHLTASFNSGVSPVIYARQQYHPMAPVPVAAPKQKLVWRIPDIADWAVVGVFWVLLAPGVATILFSILTALLVTSAALKGRMDKEIGTNDMVLGLITLLTPVGMMFLTGVFAVAVAFSFRFLAKISGHPAAP